MDKSRRGWLHSPHSHSGGETTKHIKKKNPHTHTRAQVKRETDLQMCSWSVVDQTARPANRLTQGQLHYFTSSSVTLRFFPSMHQGPTLRHREDQTCIRSYPAWLFALETQTNRGIFLHRQVSAYEMSLKCNICSPNLTRPTGRQLWTNRPCPVS